VVLIKRFITVAFFAVLSSSLLAQQTSIPTWKLYYDSAQAFWDKDWSKTIPLLVWAEKSALNDLGIYDPNYLTILNDLGLAYSHLKDYTNAEKLLARNISIKTELGNTTGDDFFNSLNNLAEIHAEQGHVKQAAQLYKRIISSQAKIGPEIYWSGAKSLLYLYETNGYLDSASYFGDVLKSNASQDTGNDVGATYELNVARARIKRKQHKYEEARAILETVTNALKDQREPELLFIYIQGLQETGLVNFETGSINNAEKNLLQGFRLLKSTQPVNNNLLIELLNNLASVYERLNIYDKATAYYQEALALCLRINGPGDLSSITLKSNIAGINLRQGDFKKAIESYEEILKNINADERSKIFHITVLNNLGTAYRKNNSHEQASARLELAHKLLIGNNLEQSDLAATVLNNIAVLRTAQGEPDKAMPFYEKAYTLKKSLYGDKSVALMDLAGNMAVVYWALNRHDLAIPLFRQSIAMGIRQIKYTFPNLSENEQVQFYQKLKEDFERFNAVAFQSTKESPELLKQVFNNQIVLKSLLFFTQQHRRDLINEKRDSILSQQYELLRARREQLGYFYQLSLKDLATAELSAADLESEIDKLEKAISMKTSETVSEKMMESNIHWEDIQRTMQDDEGLIELIRFRKYDLKVYVENAADRVRFGFTDSIYYASLITTKETAKSPQLVLLKEGINMETRFLSYYRNALTYKVDDANSYDSYWKPFEKFVGTKSKVFISGDGVYHRLNLNTLRESKNSQYLLQRYEIHYLLNPAQFMEKQTPSRSSKIAALFGDPAFETNEANRSKNRTDEFQKFGSLPGTNTEINRINDILKKNGWATNVFLKRVATEKNLKNVRSPDILHIATHGFFSIDQVRLSADAKNDFLFHSGLVFAGANKNSGEETREINDDGILTAYEVMNLDLSNTRLVVLSACETGLGKIENGEGVYGLQRSFLQAGARNILISLWKVDDLTTQELMTRFYQYVFQGKHERDALKLAQLDQLKKYNYPISWGGFIMVGLD